MMNKFKDWLCSLSSKKWDRGEKEKEQDRDFIPIRLKTKARPRLAEVVRSVKRVDDLS
jgi:hypothetical protein